MGIMAAQALKDSELTVVRTGAAGLGALLDGRDALTPEQTTTIRDALLARYTESKGIPVDVRAAVLDALGRLGDRKLRDVYIGAMGRTGADAAPLRIAGGVRSGHHSLLAG